MQSSIKNQTEAHTVLDNVPVQWATSREVADQVWKMTTRTGGEMDRSCNSVSTKNELIKLIYSLVSEVKSNPNQWENNDLPSFLEAMASWMEDMEGFYENMNKPYPDDVNWSVLGDILMAARVYE